MFLVQSASPLPNFAAISALYSQFAGVLAGFSFAGLVAVVTTRRGRATQSVQPISIPPLISAFIALCAASLNYAVIAGEPPETNRIAALETIAGMGFCVAGIMLVYSILALLFELQQSESRLGSAASDLLRNALVVVLPPLLVLLMWGGLRDHMAARHGGSYRFNYADTISIAALVAVSLWGVALRVANSHRPADQAALAGRLSGWSLQLALGSVMFATALIAVTEPDTLVWDGIPIAALLVVAGFSAFAAYSASRFPGKPRSTAPPNSQGSSEIPERPGALEAPGPSALVTRRPLSRTMLACTGAVIAAGAAAVVLGVISQAETYRSRSTGGRSPAQ